MVMKIDYKDDVFEGNRKYNMITNEDGTISFEDVTQLIVEGDPFGAADINATNRAIFTNSFSPYTVASSIPEGGWLSLEGDGDFGHFYWNDENPPAAVFSDIAIKPSGGQSKLYSAVPVLNSRDLSLNTPVFFTKNDTALTVSFFLYNTLLTTGGNVNGNIKSTNTMSNADIAHRNTVIATTELQVSNYRQSADVPVGSFIALIEE